MKFRITDDTINKQLHLEQKFFGMWKRTAKRRYYSSSAEYSDTKAAAVAHLKTEARFLSKGFDVVEEFEII